MNVTIKKTKVVLEQVKINSIVRSQRGEVVGLFPYGSDADEFMKKWYLNGTVERVDD